MHPNTRSRLLRQVGQPQLRDTQRLLRRIACQIDYASALCDLAVLAPEDAARSLAEARRLADGADHRQGLSGLEKTAAEVETALLPFASLAKGITVHLVGHGHIDMNWMWSWPETCATTHDTFASVLSLMEQYPDLTFSQSQASVYEIMERLHPDMFEQIRRRVKEGRWEVTACHWVEGDKNIVQGESIARHLLYTRAYFKDRFGLAPEDVEVDWEPDTFGHANTIPTILAQGGVKYYYSCRTGGGHHHARVGEERPPVFWWQGPDGSRVLVNRETTWYNSYVNIGENYALPAVAFRKQTGLSDWLDIYGVGNHGGGPTRAELDYYLESRQWPIWPTVIFSTAHAWFRKVEPQCGHLPVLDHELNYEFTGCYTSQSAIKRANRFGENLCLEAETLNALAGSGAPEGEALAVAWKNVLFNQFHDILPGSGVAATREHALGLFQETAAVAGAQKRNALKVLLKDVDTASLLPDDADGDDERELLASGDANAPFSAGAGQGAGLSGFSRASGGGKRFVPFVVFNPCAWPRTEIVEAHLYDTELDASRLVARDEKGNSYPTLVTANRAWEWDHTRTSIVFPAVDIPPLGYKTFLICEGVADAQVPMVELHDETTLDTPFGRLSFDRYRTGATLEKKPSKPGDWLPPFGTWFHQVEQPRGMTSWVLGGEKDGAALGVKRYEVRGAARNQGTDLPGGKSFLYMIDQTIDLPGNGSTLSVRAFIHGLEPRVDFVAELDWREIGTEETGIPGLLVQVVGTEESLYRFETPFGSVQRPLSEGEVPTLRYSSLGDVTLLQDSKYGNEVDGCINMRVVRSSFDPDHAPEVGKQTIRYSVVFHDGAPTPSELTRLGAAWNHPLIVVPAQLQEGTSAPSRSFGEVLSRGVVLSSLKPAEDGEGVIARLVEYDGVDAEAIVRLDLGLKEASQCDLMERPCPGVASFHSGTLRVPVPANSFVSVRLR